MFATQKQYESFNKELLENAKRALESLGKTFQIDRSSSTLHEAIRNKKCDVAIVLSKKAIREYETDDGHPERIAFVFAFDTSFYVVVNNRNLDLHVILRSYTERGGLDYSRMDKTCVVCYDGPKKKTYSFMTCSDCRSPLCVKCMKKMGFDEIIQCPVCRKWSLSGMTFGTPFDHPQLGCLGGYLETSAGDHGIGALVDVVKQLDGNVTLVPKIGDAFLLSESIESCRLTGAAGRMLPGSFNACGVRKKLQKFINVKNGFLRVYLLRNTFEIRDRPVIEISAFQVVGFGTEIDIVQLGIGAWVNPFDDINHDYSMRKVEYIKPVKLPLPVVVRDIMTKINSDNAILKTYFACCAIDDLNKKGTVGSWDCDKSGNNTTMSDERIEVFFSSLFRSAKISETKIWLFCVFEGVSQNAINPPIGFEMDEQSSMKMSDSMCIQNLRKTISV